MKKIYFLPITEEVKFDASMLMQQLDAGSDAPTGGWGSPLRKFEGDVQGIKYLAI